MNPKHLASTLLVTTFFAFPLYLMSRSDGAPNGSTGANFPGELSCTQSSCHDDGSANSGSGSLSITINGTPASEYTYTPGETVPVAVRLVDSAAFRIGFQLTARTGDGCEPGGSMVPGEGQVQVFSGSCGSNRVQWATHIFPKVGSDATYTTSWTAPAEGAGPVTFGVAGNGANGNGTDSGDNIYHIQAVSQPAANTGGPVQISVVHAASFTAFEGASALASNTFGTVFGETGGSAVAQEAGRLLPDVPVNDWADDFVDGVAPTALSGVRVVINGRDSFVSFIGRAEDLGTNLDQINFVAPDDDALGPVTVEVFQGDQMVAASMLNRGTVSPGLFAFGVFAGGTLPAAVAADSTFIAPVGFFQGLDTRPARSGETVLLFGSGFGATEPPIPAGQIVTELSQIPSEELMITIGGLPAAVAFAGLAPNLTGLHQFNVVVPQLPNGNHALVIERAGIRSQDGIAIPVENP